MIAVLSGCGFTDAAIAAICGRDRSKVSLHRRRMGIPALPRQGAPVPETFVDDARTTPSSELAKHYERSARTIRRWRSTLGLQAVAPRRILRQVKRTLWAKPPTFTQEQRAANVLRRHYANVFRCDLRISERGRETFGSARGLPDNGANHWFVAKLGILTRDEMMQRAREMGFTDG